MAKFKTRLVLNEVPPFSRHKWTARFRMDLGKIQRQTGTRVAHDDEQPNCIKSTLMVGVPEPRSLDHNPGIFLRLSNPAGESFTSLDPTDVRRVIEFLSTHLGVLDAAFEQATLQSRALRANSISTHNNTLPSPSH